MTLKDFYYREIPRAQRENQTWRYGQTVYNILQRERLDLSDQIVGTDLDPFYRPVEDGEFWTRFINWLEENWEK